MLVCKAMGYQLYENLLYNFNLPSLADRRQYLRLCIMYKILNDLVFSPNNVFIQENSSVLSHLLFPQPFTHKNCFCASGLFYSWDALQSHVSNSSSLSETLSVNIYISLYRCTYSSAICTSFAIIILSESR